MRERLRSGGIVTRSHLHLGSSVASYDSSPLFADQGGQRQDRKEPRTESVTAGHGDVLGERGKAGPAV